MALIAGTELDELPNGPDGLANRALPGSFASFGELGFSTGFGAGFLLGVQESVLREVTVNIATTVSTYVIDKQSGDPHLVSAGDLAATVVRLKKVGSGFSTISPTITARETFVDISLTALNLDTLGICDLTVDIPGCIVAPIRLNVIAMNKADSVRAGLTALPNTSPGAGAGIATFNNVDAVGTAVTTVNTKLGTPAGASVSADIASISSKLGAPAGASVSADIASVSSSVSAVSSSVATVNTKLGTPAGASVSADIASVNSKLGTPVGASISADISTLLASNASLLVVVNHLQKAAFNRWKIEGTQLTIFDDDGTSPLQVFDLKDDLGNASNSKIFERVPV